MPTAQFTLNTNCRYDGTHGSLVGLHHDPCSNVYWSYTEYAVYKYQVPPVSYQSTL